MTRAYYDDEAVSYRRYSGRGHSYPLSQDRELPPAPGHSMYSTSRIQHPLSHESQTSDNSSQNDTNSRPRSRIPVACGRCRKRKIRCSGDQGGPCSNCKSAGNDQCQFLRVSSLEAQMKSDAAGYDYDPSGAAARLNCRMIQYGPLTYSPHTLSVDTYQYRSGSINGYPYTAKSYYPIAPFNEFGEENVDYGFQGSSYQILPAEALGASNYTASNAGRGWTPQPQVPKNPLFLEQPESAYSHGQLSYHGNHFSLRTAVGPESRALSLAGSNTTLPASLLGTDRVLPFPASNRPSQIGTLSRPADGLTLSQQGVQAYSSLASSGTHSTIKPHSMCTVSENGSLPSAYIPMPSSSPESLASSQIAYHSQHNDIHPSHDGLYHGDQAESSYGHSPVPKRPSRGSQTDGEDSLQSTSAGNLANGQPYQPLPYHQPSYPTPQVEIAPPLPTPARRSITTT